MAEYFVDPLNGNDAAAGTIGAPWKLIPGQTGANAVVNGDTINVRNGTTTTLRVVPPQQNLVYRGYGLADNVLNINIPMPFVPWKTYPARIVRELGVHEGMWTINQGTINGSGIGNGGSTINVTLEDVQILGPSLVSTQNLIQIGTSASSGALTGFTLRRFDLAYSNNRGISIFGLNLTAEYGKIRYCQNDNVTLFATAGSTQRTGSVDTFRYVEFIEPNLASERAESGTEGDFVQNVPESGAYNASTIIEYCTGYKTTRAKQAFVFHNTSATSKVQVKFCKFYGGGATNILASHNAGLMEFSNLFFEFPTPTQLPLIRFDPSDSSPPAYAMATGSRLIIKNIVALGLTNGFYSSVRASGAYSFDGTITIKNNTALGTSYSTLNGASAISLWASDSSTTYGVNFILNLQNNLFGITGAPNIVMPTGTAGDVRFRVQNNSFTEESFAIGATTYDTLAAFQAAHASAVNNITGDPETTSEGYPNSTSPLIGAGINTGYIMDIKGKAFWNPPSIGAYEYERARVART